MSTNNLIEEHLHSSAHMAKKHIHPKLMKMMELGGMASVFERGEGAYLYDMKGERYLDFLSGGGVHFVGRNHPKVIQAMQDVLSANYPNLAIINASILGGIAAEKLKELMDFPDSKVVFANSGSEATEVALRFARYVTRRRRYLYLDGAFHGRTWGAISVNGWAAMKEGMEPMLPTCTPLPPNDLGALRRELARGDVAGIIMEPVQGMTLIPLDPGYMREAARLCKEHGTLLIADEVQTGFGRCGEWFLSRSYGIKPDIITTSKTISGGHMPVSAVVVSEETYNRVYDKFTSGPFYFSTFAENNLAMAATVATIEALKDIDAPARAQVISQRIRDGVMKLAEKHDVIDRVIGKGLMIGIIFKESEQLALKVQQRVLKVAEPTFFGAAVNVDMYTKQKVIVQVPGPGLNAIKILPPAVTSDADADYFVQALDNTLTSFYKTGPAMALGQSAVKDTIKTVKEALPGIGKKNS
ncbi:MAG: aspartate aminotransferase family protein [Deltaproteobacteria bacterium]|nr:aspartate aminotransferase family protein [Deltaproteobacteria bacterium]